MGRTRTAALLSLPLVVFLAASADAADEGPLSPPERAYQQTSRQSTSQVVADLGNLFVKANSCNRETHYALSDLQGWALTIPCNVKVRRLIEEGRQNPRHVAALIEIGLDEAIDAYPGALRDYQRRIERYRKGSGQHGSLPENDPTYARSRTYDDPLFELPRLHYVIYASLYVLANIDGLDDDVLRPWLALEPSLDVRCMELDAWFVHLTDRARRPKFAQSNVRAAPELAVTRVGVPPWWHLGGSERAAPLVVLQIPISLSIERGVGEAMVQGFLKRQ